MLFSFFLSLSLSQLPHLPWNMGKLSSSKSNRKPRGQLWPPLCLVPSEAILALTSTPASMGKLEEKASFQVSRRMRHMLSSCTQTSPCVMFYRETVRGQGKTHSPFSENLPHTSLILCHQGSVTSLLDKICSVGSVSNISVLDLDHSSLGSCCEQIQLT